MDEKARRMRENEINALLRGVLDAIHADAFDPLLCNITLGRLNDALFRENLGEQCAFQCAKDESFKQDLRPSGIAFFSPAGRRYSGTRELTLSASLTAEVNEDRTVWVRKNRWGNSGEFSSLITIEWFPGSPGYTFTTWLV